ncbi:Voltage-dependent L-type calcium channel subunit beta-4 [Exaiptasia diaphana]|nr:Voltage-dependent L-type calcium channel subunit beta-4 [Exaiptasia diaphana]
MSVRRKKSVFGSMRRKNSRSPNYLNFLPDENGLTLEERRRKISSISSSSEFSMPPYEVVPATRPIIVLGPSLRGYEVTDLMHKALYNYLKKRFSGRIHIFKAHTDIGLSKRSSKNNPSEKGFGLTKSSQRVTHTKRMMLSGLDFPDRPNPMLSSHSGRSTSFKDASERKQSMAPLKLDHLHTPRLSICSADGNPAQRALLEKNKGKKDDPKQKLSQSSKQKISEAGRNAPGFQVTQYEDYPQGYEEDPQNGYDYYYRDQGYEQGFDYAAENPYGSPMALQEYGTQNQYPEQSQYMQDHYQEGHYHEGHSDYGQYGTEQGYQQDYGHDPYVDQQYMQEGQYAYQGEQNRYDISAPNQMQGYGNYDDRYPNDGGYY